MNESESKNKLEEVLKPVTIRHPRDAVEFRYSVGSGSANRKHCKIKSPARNYVRLKVSFMGHVIIVW
ncbi:hypothetical protein MWL72_06955 [Escherichia coli]|nr:hypothetical protein [Escherichia coli]